VQNLAPATCDGNSSVRDTSLRIKEQIPSGRLVFADSAGSTLMAKLEDGQIVETPTEARQAEPGPSVLLLLSISLALAVVILGVVWMIFFKT
jgi:hypothetical protein